MRQILLAAVVLTSSGTAAAQAPAPLAVGTVAPDFALVGASRNGVMPAPVRLSDLRDQTVIIAFFYRARTRG